VARSDEQNVNQGFSRKSTEGISNNRRCLAKRHFPACRQAGANRRVNACLSADRAEAKMPIKGTSLPRQPLGETVILSISKL